MDFIQKNKKAFAIVNTVLVIAAVILEIIGIFTEGTLVTDKIFNVLLIIGLSFGLVYVWESYSKGAARYYKIFMIIFAVIALYNFAIGIFSGIGAEDWIVKGQKTANIVGSVINGISLAAVVVLAFGKNLGKNLSLALALLVLALALVNLVIAIAVFSDFAAYAGIYIGSVLLPLSALFFVSAKYADKSKRGTK